MLNIKDIISLANAGYTADQIDEMQKQDAGQQQQDVGQNQQDAGQNQQDAGQNQQDSGQNQQNVGQQINAPSSVSEKILKELEDMRAALQSSNIGASRQPSNDSLDDILASIISPKPNFDK